jgi:hypothetical protein
MNAINNIKYNKKIIVDEMKNKLIDKNEGNSILAHLNDMENNIKNKNKNKSIHIHDLIKHEHGHGHENMKGGGLGINVLLVLGIRQLLQKNITNDFTANCILSYIQNISNFMMGKKMNVEEFSKAVSTWVVPTEGICPVQGFTEIPLPHLSNEEAKKMYMDMENVPENLRSDLTKRITQMAANQTRMDKIIPIIATFFQGEQSKYMLAFLTNNYTTIGISFGLGVIAFAGASQLLKKTSKIIAYSYNQNKPAPNKMDAEIPIMLPPIIKDNNVKINLDQVNRWRRRSSRRRAWRRRSSRRRTWRRPRRILY